MFPSKLKEPKYPDPDNPNEFVGRSEVERRRTYFEQLERAMPERQTHFVQLIKDCLHDVPSKRPTTEKLVSMLKSITIEGK